MKILAIGNSFSEDATRYLQSIAKSAGDDLFVRNIYIGGCSLERHMSNVKSGEVAYQYQIDSANQYMISIDDALTAESWDMITVQQNSGNSGFYETYEPYLTELLAHIKEKAPKAKISFVETWAYEFDAPHAEFPKYDRDQEKMFKCILNSVSQVEKNHGLDIIRVGEAVQRARSQPGFDYINGKGLSLCRDGFHLSVPYGRFLAGLVWYKYFTGRDVRCVTYRPDGADEALVQQLMEIV